MSKLVVVAVRDDAVSAYSRPYFVRTKGEALRSFEDEVNRTASDNAMAAHPEHFGLYYLGLYDEIKGTFTCQDPELIVRAMSCVRKADTRTLPLLKDEVAHHPV